MATIVLTISLDQFENCMVFDCKGDLNEAMMNKVLGFIEQSNERVFDYLFSFNRPLTLVGRCEELEDRLSDEIARIKNLLNERLPQSH
jgi:hypothetical protein